jgi:ferrous iron transport protein B
MSITIALVGNPNSGKTTMFNDLTGSNQYVGNWPGVTVEKKMGYLKDDKEIQIQDLPGIYSLSPYTMEEVVSRNFLLDESPDVILNIVDASNIERNLYLTTQLLELGIPVVIALNMIDVIRKKGDTINIKELERVFGCPVFETSALLKQGSREAVQKATELARMKKDQRHLPSIFEGTVEHSIAHIEEIIEKMVTPDKVRWYAIKLFERDKNIQEKLGLSPDQLEHIEEHIASCEKDLDDDSESIIISQRYLFITKQIDRLVVKRTLPKKRFLKKLIILLPTVILLCPFSPALFSWFIIFL